MDEARIAAALGELRDARDKVKETTAYVTTNAGFLSLFSIPVVLLVCIVLFTFARGHALKRAGWKDATDKRRH